MVKPYEGESLEEQAKNIPRDDWDAAMSYRSECLATGRIFNLGIMVLHVFGGRPDINSQTAFEFARHGDAILWLMLQRRLLKPTDTPGLYEVSSGKPRP